jgi:glycerophosphoryl diester phosphodiesterase
MEIGVMIMRANVVRVGILLLGIGCGGFVMAGPSGHTRSVEIIAHRGASDEAPENTLAAVNLAWRQRADAVEVDVYQSKDGRIVVLHDGTTKRTAGVDKPVTEQTLAELKALDAGTWKAKRWAGERIPTLAEVLATIPKGRRMFVEIKCGPAIVPELQAVVKASKKSPQQIVFISFSPEACSAVKRALPAHAVYLLCGFRKDEKTGRWLPTAEELMALARNAKLDGVDLGAAEPMNADLVAKIKAAGLGVFVWTVDDVGLAKSLVKAGVDGITTDQPGSLRKQLATPQAK